MCWRCAVDDGESLQPDAGPRRIDTRVEVDYYRNGGILHTVLRNMANADD